MLRFWQHTAASVTDAVDERGELDIKAPKIILVLR